MSKTIETALKDEIEYPLKKGLFENVLIKRDLNGSDDFTFEVSKSASYRGAVADCYVKLIMSPNATEGDMSFSQTEKNTMLKIANSIYLSIDEEPVDIADKPIVYIEN